MSCIMAEKPTRPYSQICSICCELKLWGIEDIDQLRLADICYECWHAHIKSFVNRITYKAGDAIISPFNQGNPIELSQCINSLRKHDAQEIEEIVFRKYCAFTKEVQKCPSEICNFVYIGEKCKWGSNENIYNCPKCEMPLTAQRTLTMKSLMASFYLLMANKCPKCDIPIEKISGCPHMTCPCGHHFCWYCYKDHPSGTLKRVYQLHTIPECAFIFISKIILIIVCMVNLLVTFNGNWVLKSIFAMLGVLLSVLMRAVLLDGFILLQVLFLMMQKRRSYTRFTTDLKRKYAIIYILINVIGIGILYLLDQFSFFTKILVGELVIAGVGFVLCYGVMFSIETWFQFVG